MNPEGRHGVTPPDDEIIRRYREAAGETPPPELDALVLAEAHAPAVPTRHPRPWWRAWMVPASVAAAAVIGLSLSLRVHQEEQRKAAELAAPSAPATEGVAQPAPSAPVPAEQPAPSPPSAPVRDTVPRADTAKPAPAPGPRPFPAAPSPQLPATRPPYAKGALSPEAPTRHAAPATAEPQQRLREAARAAPAEQRSAAQEGDVAQREIGAAKDAAPAPARPAGSPPLRDESAAAASVTPAAKDGMPDDAPTPGEWLDKVRQLQAAGRVPEAKASLARFRLRYPHFSLPGDLAPLAEPAQP